MVQQKVIERPKPGGFFSNFFSVLVGLEECHQNGLAPVIGVNQVVRPSGVFTTLLRRNIVLYNFETYFHLRIIDKRLDLKMPVEKRDSGFSPELLLGKGALVVGDAYRRNLDLTPYVREILIEVMDEMGLTNRRFISAHSRFSDMSWTPSHPTPPKPIAVFSRALSESVLLGCPVIFVSADSSKAVKRFHRLGSKRVQVLSLSNYGGRFKKDLEQDPNLQVLLEALIHSQSEAMVHSNSNVSFAARVFRGHGTWRRISFDCGTNPSSLPIAVLRSSLRALGAEHPDHVCRVSIFEEA